MESWLPHNLEELVGYIGVIGGLIFNGISIRSETKARRITNMLMTTQNHREIWSDYTRNPNVWRVLDPSARISTEKVTKAEEAFVSTVIQHINSVYQMMKDGLTIRPEGMGADISSLFSLPVVEAVWNKMKGFQDEDFVVFIEACVLNDKSN